MNDIQDPDIHTLLMTEINIMSKLQHPNVIRQFEHGSDNYKRADGSVKRKLEYIVLEIAKGGELFDYIVSKGRLAPDEARHFFHQSGSGVEYCHDQHRGQSELEPEHLWLE